MHESGAEFRPSGNDSEQYPYVLMPCASRGVSQVSGCSSCMIGGHIVGAMMSSRVYIIAGPNGAGKTTFAREFLPNYADCKNFINADLIAQGVSPFSPETAAFRAGGSCWKRSITMQTAARTSASRQLFRVGVIWGWSVISRDRGTRCTFSIFGCQVLNWPFPESGGGCCWGAMMCLR